MSPGNPATDWTASRWFVVAFIAVWTATVTYVIVDRRHSAERARKLRLDPSSPTRDLSVILEFKRRRIVFFATVAAAFALIALPFAGEDWVPVLILRGLRSLHPQGAFYALTVVPFIAGVSLFATALYRFRCPSCGIPFAKMHGNQNGIQLAPERCPDCAVPLR